MVRKIWIHIRIACWKLSGSKAFETVVMAVIICNSIYIAVDDQTMENNHSISIRKIIENTFSAIYITEFIIKVTGMGFIFKKGSYLRDYWNIIDFLIIL